MQKNKRLRLVGLILLVAALLTMMPRAQAAWEAERGRENQSQFLFGGVLQATTPTAVQQTPLPTPVEPERERSPILLAGALLVVAVILVGAAIHSRYKVPEDSSP